MVTKRQKPITRTVKGFNWKVIGRFYRLRPIKKLIKKPTKGVYA